MRALQYLDGILYSVSKTTKQAKIVARIVRRKQHSSGQPLPGHSIKGQWHYSVRFDAEQIALMTPEQQAVAAALNADKTYLRSEALMKRCVVEGDFKGQLPIKFVKDY